MEARTCIRTSHRHTIQLRAPTQPPYRHIRHRVPQVHQPRLMRHPAIQEPMLDVTRYANKLKKYMEETGWYEESPEFRHQRQPLSPETIRLPIITPDVLEPTRTPNPEQPQQDTPQPAPVETTKTPMEPKKIISDLDGDYWKPADKPYNAPGRRLRNRTIPTAVSEHTH